MLNFLNNVKRIKNVDIYLLYFTIVKLVDHKLIKLHIWGSATITIYLSFLSHEYNFCFFPFMQVVQMELMVRVAENYVVTVKIKNVTLKMEFALKAVNQVIMEIHAWNVSFFRKFIYPYIYLRYTSCIFFFQDYYF